MSAEVNNSSVNMASVTATDQDNISSIRKKLNIVIPAYNEAESITLVLEELDLILQSIDLDCTIIIIDDGSSDSTTTVALDAKLQTPLKIIRLSRNFGKEIAMSAGLNEASVSDAVIVMDADGQHPPASIIEFVQLWQQGFENISAIRKARDTDRWLKRNLSALFYKLLPKDVQFIKSNAGDFRLLSSRVVHALNQMPEKNRFMKGLYNWVGFKTTTIFYDHRHRFGGQTKFTLRALLHFAITGITSFSTFPLRLISRLGFLISCVSIIYGLYIFLRTILFGIDLPGWASLTIAITLLSGIQLISIGVLGEYIGQIFIEAKNRPLYIIDEIVTKTPNTDD